MFKKLYFSLSLLMLVCLSSLANAEEISARQVVEEFQNQLLSVMKAGKELGFQGRYDKLDVAVKKSHDLPKIARIVVGKQWEELTTEQQNKLESVFSKLSVSAYAHNFKDYSGESFTFASEEETGRGGVVIHTNLHIPGEKDVKFDYMMKKKDDGWQIINIIADGVSDLALKRSDYTSVLSRDGFDALIVKITEKIESYAKQ
ncbi:ABC transporter substrate-binding protein [Methylomonas sp. BW4-1]|uniref:ABC transporter substrate-binding protein n=1 Tax=Methylomonas defluvii TaxID=3045149 RepID=A0ABU4UDB7_9GAMM|nr:MULTISPECIES: ABC transporter substrate-binding protein [unclassified Methylomonas]MDX8127413.1 ABC transporter substrate-binding protein [Methylomonas sp. OY6]PKD39666.1 hopanoid biosynthesis protein HpnM [Methylomonas sp. Kb3]QSB02258.1 ABC transporter substrate-binding protein [Methylomonas sp. EFPC1]